ncbi:1-(5-phosphoribosyl)-5-[(5-phosphoribosylamino)methylideneamino]imidazole-4-carboxamide isomerase [Fructobacillus tropaeoli]|uniref:1-(5-phosphoribosyl)-5-[(5- phosphoribosylamino)methylideneamino]imidazole-4- carboxamide isomerase n=1 Tax=Fructobacillus tropaeoli TaxID=709323 RepID=UPI00145613B9|nr:1-(5-phosphoribosyl)-5-[(5-phosphoribosylamino)methylideneamino]imidazole-4-carboxamide isomerase [Fructobacillus tropaeoli]NLS37823.1 1-(5-phosphoribosyl)-5-[(5-phosphoribosylamino)methylideneamino]imidazole-4-carboxamide isomerase [Fructobacillus tropaeoli]
MIFPAIDLLGGESVRLYQGDYQKKMVVEKDPLTQLQAIESAGLRQVHLVDLDGAKKGLSVNADLIRRLRENSDIFLELGGGIRTLQQIDDYLQLGINRVILGSIAVTNPELVQEAVTRFGPEKIVVGVDGQDGQVKTAGWTEASQQSFAEVVSAMTALGVTNFIVTDISRDGTLSGPNVALLKQLQQDFPASRFVVSGGVSTLADIATLQESGLVDMIVGRALYDGDLTLADLKEAEDGVSETNYSSLGY